MTRRWSLFLATMTLLAGAAPARATVGGPTLLDVLGWDPLAKRVYVHFVDTSGGGFFGDVVSFAPDSGAVGVPEPWVRHGEESYADPVLLGKLADLRRRLAPMAVEPAAVMPWVSRVVARDSLDDGYPGQVVRYRVRARWEREPEFEFTTWGSPEVLLKAVYVIPGHAARLFVFAFTGDRMESGYETQAPVIVAPGETGLRAVGWQGAR
jgi:hypothetical protein